MVLAGVDHPIYDDPYEEVEKLRHLCAALYQILGVLGASEEVLDAVSDASTGFYHGNPDNLLPYTQTNGNDT
jgi:hypothetical protein